MIHSNLQSCIKNEIIMKSLQSLEFGEKNSSTLNVSIDLKTFNDVLHCIEFYNAHTCIYRHLRIS